MEQPSHLRLTTREREVLRCLARGMSNREIADCLVISVSTVQNHLHHIFDKLEARNRTMAVLLAQQRGYYNLAEMDGSIDAPASGPTYADIIATS